jgi:hypothetical protein
VFAALRGAGSVRDRGLIASVAVVALVRLGAGAPHVATLVDFQVRRAHYARVAEAGLTQAQQDGRPLIASVPDARDLFFVYVYDPNGLGVHARRAFTEVPAACRPVVNNWMHCARS